MLCLHPQEMNSLQRSRCMGQSVGRGFPELVSPTETPGAHGADLFACTTQCIYYIRDNLQRFSWHCRTLWIVLIQKGNPTHTNVTTSNSRGGRSRWKSPPFSTEGSPAVHSQCSGSAEHQRVRASSPSSGPGAAQSAGRHRLDTDPTMCEIQNNHEHKNHVRFPSLCTPPVIFHNGENDRILSCLFQFSIIQQLLSQTRQNFSHKSI